MEVKEVRLTDELKTKLAGCLGFSVDAEFKYVPKAYRLNNVPKDFWPVFVLKSLDGLEAASREDASGFMTLDQSTKETKLHIESGAARIETLEKGIRSVKNFYFEDGRIANYDLSAGTLVFSREGRVVETKKISTRDFIRYLRPELQIELQNAINERAVLTEEELRGLE